MNPYKTLFVLFLFVAMSFGFGYRNYVQTKQEIVSDLNQALQRSVMQNMDFWVNRDSIYTYTRLQEMMEAPVTVSSSNRFFTNALSLPKLKEISGLSLHILKKGEQGDHLPEKCLVSDTLLLLTPAGMASSDLVLSFRGYARCSNAMIFSLSDQRMSSLLFLAALLWGVISYAWFVRRNKAVGLPDSGEKELIRFGNLTLSCEENCFYNEQQEELKFTPLQYALMEMFYLSSSHKLLKTDICESLWPGKENADETLYTLIRRLKPVVEEQSNLKITTDRGRAYALELKA
ncbi:MAG: winged helix-turn-helix domain-containing protein [Bacteroides sp.]|nr:winged helix-turn-helix domain-containing protein [Bacteroides sp.]